jgi:phage terminase large subunit GpA-like protein
MSARDLPDHAVRAQALVDECFSNYLAPPPRVSVAKWADDYRHVAKGPERGRWRNERTPYLVEPMECASSFSLYEQIVMMFATQLGKTEVLYNAIGQRIHTEPQDMMMVQPTLQDAQDHSSKRFLPTVLATPILRERVATRKSRDESTSWRSRTIRGDFAVYFAGANSASSLASKPLGFAVADEVDKWPADVDNEGPAAWPARRADVQLRQAQGDHRVDAHDPGCIRDRIALPGKRPAQVFRAVSALQRDAGPRLGRGSAARDQVAQDGRRRRPTGNGRLHLHRVRCAAIEEFHKTEMLAAGMWRAQAPGAGRGKVAGFWLNKLYSPLGWRSWEELVDEWVNAVEKYRVGNSGPLKKFRNSSLAETYEEKGRGADDKALAARAKQETYTLGIVPRGGLLCSMGVDTQPDRLEARVWAFGRGEESWLVARHVIYGDPNLEEGTQGSPWTVLTEIRRTLLQHASGAQIPIEATFVDSGGHNTHAVYMYCRAHSHAHVHAIKGSSIAGRPVLGKPSHVDVNWRGRTLKGGVKLWSIGTDTAKDLLYGRMRLERVGTGYVHVPAELAGTDEFEQMTAAKLMPVTVNGRRVMRWVTPAGKREEAGDCMVYAYAAACYLGIQNYREHSWARREQRYQPKPDLFQEGVDTYPQAATPAPAAARPRNRNKRGEMRTARKSPAAGPEVQPKVTPAPTASPTPRLDALVKADPDLVDRIFDYAVKLMPEIAAHRVAIVNALRDEFAGSKAYVRKRGDVDPVAVKVLSIFNGRNATETARELGIGRATVYRKIKQPGRKD